MSMPGENIQDLFRQAGGPKRTAAAAVQAAAAATVRSAVMANVVVVCMPMDVMRHMMTMSVVRRRMMMHSGRGRRGEQKRCRDDNRQDREEFTHERLHKEHFQ